MVSEKNVITSFLLKVKSKVSFQEAEKGRLYCSTFETRLGFKVGALSSTIIQKVKKRKKQKEKKNTVNQP